MADAGYCNGRRHNLWEVVLETGAIELDGIVLGHIVLNTLSDVHCILPDTGNG